MSFEEFLALGETMHHEYYDGLCIVNPPDRRHVRIVKHLERGLDEVCPADHEVLVGWCWAPVEGEMFQPDVMVVARDAVDSDVLRDPPPKLVIEVTSRSTRIDDRQRKLQGYANHGAEWYWIVDILVPEVVALENRSGAFEQVARLEATGSTPGPVQVVLDPARLANL